MKSICGFSLSSVLVAAALVALLALPCATQSEAAEEQQTMAPGFGTHETPHERIINKRIADGYAVMGPAELGKGTSSSRLVLPGVPDNPEPTVSLSGKKVAVMDEHGTALTMGSVSAGKNAIICQKKDEVIIYVVPDAKKETSDAK